MNKFVAIYIYVKFVLMQSKKKRFIVNILNQLYVVFCNHEDDCSLIVLRASALECSRVCE